MASGGVGRGGRGAALLKALGQPSRKPGDVLEEKDESKSTTSSVPVPTVPAPVKQETRPGGRGQFLASLLKNGKSADTQQQQSGPSGGEAGPSTTVVPSTVPAPARPMGRGMNALRAALLASEESAQQRQVPHGQQRSAPLPGQQQRSAPLPGQQRSAPPSAQEQQTAFQDQQRTSQEKPIDIATSMKQLAVDQPQPPKAVESFKGLEGKPLDLAVNYVRLRCRNHSVYQYHVLYQPEIDNKNIRFKLLNTQREIIGETKAFDGSILYLPKKFDDEETILSASTSTHTDVMLTIKFVKAVPAEQCIHVYNVIFKRIMRILELKQMGRYYFNPNTPLSVPQHKLEMWPGYITSVREYEGGLLMLADATHRVLRTETVLDFIYSVVKRNQRGFQDEVTRAVVGAIVLTRYNNKTYRVDDIAWDKNPRHTFASTSTGEETSFVDYYRKHHNKEIHDHDQPLLLHRPKKKVMPGESAPEGTEVICLVPELCYMTGLTDEMRQDFRVMKDIAVHTRITPNQRQLALRKFVDSVTGNPEANNELLKWGLEFDDDTLKIQGRQVTTEKIHFGSSTIMVNAEADWGRDLTRSNVIRAVPLNVWTIIYTKRDAKKAGDFVQSMLTNGPRMGIGMRQPAMVELLNDRIDTFVNALRENIHERLQIYVIICPTSRDDRYAAIKKFCCVENPVPSQVINARTLGSPQKFNSVVQKVALQMNCKLGGELWAVDIPLKNLMIVGIDVYHCGNRRSVGAFVASINPAITRWYSHAIFQQPQQELIDSMQICFTSALKKYHEVNHCLPEKIVVFRDGVGDGQMKAVTEYEVKQLIKSFGLFESGYQPRLSVVVVQKRINTRIFLRSRNQLDNPPPGSVVDHTITRPGIYDFFLVSQHVRQGTVTPTHYVVVHDGSGMKPDHMQRLSYKMTHMYYNWPGTVRVPAPCQYAHKLAYLVGQSIGRDPSPQLSDRLFFL